MVEYRGHGEAVGGYTAVKVLVASAKAQLIGRLRALVKAGLVVMQAMGWRDKAGYKVTNRAASGDQVL